MPIYKYFCSTCNQTFEVMHRMTDPLPSTGPNCSANNNCEIERQLSQVAMTVRSPNPFAVQAGRKIEVEKFLPSVDKQTASERDSEPAHTCSTGCALHSR